jgi:hypothetical protein
MSKGTRLRGGFPVRAGVPAAALAALVLQLSPGCCLVAPPDAKTIFEAGNNGWRTPEAAFETFRVAFGAELAELEFRSLSTNFRREHGISLSTYIVARRELIRAKPYLAFLAEAKIVGESEISARRHRLEVSAAGRHFQVEMVCEDWFQIYSGAGFLADGPVDFGRAVVVRDAGADKVVTTELHISADELGEADLSTLTGQRIEKVWKIDSFGDAPSP